MKELMSAFFQGLMGVPINSSQELRSSSGDLFVQSTYSRDRDILKIWQENIQRYRSRFSGL